MTTEQALYNIIYSFIFKTGLIESDWSEISEKEYLYRNFTLVNYEINSDFDSPMYCCKISFDVDPISNMDGCELTKRFYIPVSEFNEYMRDVKINEIL